MNEHGRMQASIEIAIEYLEQAVKSHHVDVKSSLTDMAIDILKKGLLKHKDLEDE